MSASLNATFGSDAPRHAGEQREGAVLELHHHALQRRLRLVERQLEQLQDHRLVAPEHVAGGDARKEAVADLAGGAGHGDANGCFHCGLLERRDGAERRSARLRTTTDARQRRDGLQASMVGARRGGCQCPITDIRYKNAAAASPRRRFRPLYGQIRALIERALEAGEWATGRGDSVGDRPRAALRRVAGHGAQGDPGAGRRKPARPPAGQGHVRRDAHRGKGVELPLPAHSPQRRASPSTRAAA